MPFTCSNAGMPRAALACLAVLALAATAAADPRQTIAVVAIDGIDLRPGDANALTSALRVQASAKSGKYRSKGTPKEIEKAVFAAECKAPERACAVAIGTKLAVDYVLAGEIVARGARYVLTLSLVNVNSKERVRSLRDTAAKTVDMKRWARTLYDRLHDGATGELVIVANAKRGEILLDGQTVGVLFEGRATIGNVTVGSHVLVIRAAGYRPFEIDVAVEGTMKQNVLLEPNP